LTDAVEVKTVATDIYQFARWRIKLSVRSNSHILVDGSTKYEDDND
jgi:hypothetical protein